MRSVSERARSAGGRPIVHGRRYKNIILDKHGGINHGEVRNRLIKQQQRPLKTFQGWSAGKPGKQNGAPGREAKPIALFIAKEEKNNQCRYSSTTTNHPGCE